MDSLTASSPPTGGNGCGRQPGELVLRVETTDVDDGIRAVERVLRVTAKKWNLRRAAANAKKAVVLDYVCRLRRVYTPDDVRALLLHDGVPFVLAAEWTT
jgi:hypothetical protein